MDPANALTVAILALAFLAFTLGIVSCYRFSALRFWQTTAVLAVTFAVVGGIAYGVQKAEFAYADSHTTECAFGDPCSVVN